MVVITNQLVSEKESVSIDVPLQFNLDEDLDTWYNDFRGPMMPVNIESIVHSCEYQMDSFVLRLPFSEEHQMQLRRPGLRPLECEPLTGHGLFYAMGFVNHSCISNCD